MPKMRFVVQANPYCGATGLSHWWARFGREADPEFTTVPGIGDSPEQAIGDLLRKNKDLFKDLFEVEFGPYMTPPPE